MKATSSKQTLVGSCSQESSSFIDMIVESLNNFLSMSKNGNM